MEDFIPFEIAKKLKEKGFNEPCYKYYQKGVLDSDDCWNRYNKGTADRCSAPTISQVLKWLRDDKAIHLDIVLWKKGWYCDVWVFEYYEEEKEYTYKIEYQSNDYNSYEQTALAGIEYVLDNLI